MDITYAFAFVHVTVYVRRCRSSPFQHFALPAGVDRLAGAEKYENTPAHARARLSICLTTFLSVSFLELVDENLQNTWLKLRISASTKANENRACTAWRRLPAIDVGFEDRYQTFLSLLIALVLMI